MEASLDDIRDEETERGDEGLKQMLVRMIEGAMHDLVEHPRDSKEYRLADLWLRSDNT